MSEPHPDVVRLVAQFRADGVPTYDSVGVLKARAIAENVIRIQAPSPDVASVRDILVAGADGLLPVRVYHPSPDRRLPLVIYFHGGGWVVGSVRAADRPCRRLARAAECVVASLEYRRAPETRFPGPLLDCLAATRWLVAHSDEVGSRADGAVLLGDSAGGNLAAAAALALRNAHEPVELLAQILVYPTLSPARGTRFASYHEFAEGPLMTRRELEWFWDLYLASEADEADPLAAPLASDDLAGLPPATIILAELDPLRDEGLAYADRLRAAGVEASSTVYPGAAHGFWWMDGEMSQASELTEQLAATIRSASAYATASAEAPLRRTKPS
jgi:acetyl esterase